MSASVNDKVTDTRNAARPNSARATGTRASGGTSLACDSLVGWPTASKVHFVTYQIDSNSNPIAGTQLDCYGIVSGNTIGSFHVIDGTDNGNSVGDVVEMLPTAAWGQDLADAFTNEHSRTGTHGAITTTSISNAGTLTQTGQATFVAGTTLPAGDIGTADIANNAVTADKRADNVQAAAVATSETTTSTSYADLATTTDTVTVIIGVNGKARVSLQSYMANTTSSAQCYVSVDVSGASTVAATDINGLELQATSANVEGQIGTTFVMTGLTAGSTVFKMKYRVQTGGSGAGTGTFKNRRIAVEPL